MYRTESAKSLPAAALEKNLLEQFCVQEPLAPLGAKTNNLGKLFQALQSKNEANFLLESYQSACNETCNQSSREQLKNLTCHANLDSNGFNTTSPDDNVLRNEIRQSLLLAANGKGLPQGLAYAISILEVPGAGGEPCTKSPTRLCAACNGSSPEKCRCTHSAVLLGERCKHRGQDGRCDSCQALISGSWGTDCNFYRNTNIPEVQPDFYWSSPKSKDEKPTLQCTGHIWVDYDRLVPGLEVSTSYAN